LESQFIDLDVYAILIIDVGLKDLVRQMPVYTKMSWFLFG